MTIREILHFPDPRLREVSKPIQEITDEHRSLAKEMLQIMYDEPGIGLAAPQINERIRMAVIDTNWGEEGGEKNPLVLINPEIVEREGEITWTEGCLSVPDFQAEVERSFRVKVKALDLDGKEQVYDVEELDAVVFQHEIDHLDGVLFIDHISRLKRNLYIKKRKKMLAREEEEPEEKLPPNFFDTGNS
ncbi:MAG: peptide deformylase [Deltaproteobacteria bacterium]|nr:peptide deformylase [Deltaproteobacteria bacterium]